MPKLKINKALEKLFTAKQQIIVLYGGRGSGKSIGVGDFLTFKMATEAAVRLGARRAEVIRDRIVRFNWTVEDATTIPMGRQRPPPAGFPEGFSQSLADFCGGRPHGYSALKLGG